MKKIILSLILIFLIISFITAKENSDNKLLDKYELITYNLGDLKFKLPKDYELVVRNSVKKPDVSYIEKITVDEYINLPSFMINDKVFDMVDEGKIVTAEDLKNLLSQGESDILLSYFGLTDILESYKEININDREIVGESYFSTGDVPSYFGYSIGYLYNNVIYRIYLFKKLPEYMKEIYPEIFMEDNGYLFWNPNVNGRIKAWKLISNRDKNLPAELILLQDAYDIFLETVKFK